MSSNWGSIPCCRTLISSLLYITYIIIQLRRNATTIYNKNYRLNAAIGGLQTPLHPNPHPFLLHLFHHFINFNKASQPHVYHCKVPTFTHFLSEESRCKIFSMLYFLKKLSFSLEKNLFLHSLKQSLL